MTKTFVIITILSYRPPFTLNYTNFQLWYDNIICWQNHHLECDNTFHDTKTCNALVCVKENIEKIIWFNKYLELENLLLADTVRYVKLQFFNLVYSILDQFILIFGGVG